MYTTMDSTKIFYLNEPSFPAVHNEEGEITINLNKA